MADDTAKDANDNLDKIAARQEETAGTDDRERLTAARIAAAQRPPRVDTDAPADVVRSWRQMQLHLAFVLERLDRLADLYVAAARDAAQAAIPDRLDVARDGVAAVRRRLMLDGINDAIRTAPDPADPQ